MEDATAISYWCHMCSRSVNPVIEGEIINCNFCQSGFVEEIDETPDQVTNDHPHQPAESLWAPILLGMMNDHDHQNQRASESNVEDDIDIDDGDGDGDGDGRINDGEFDLERHLEEIMRRRRRHSAAILDLLQGIRAGLSVESENSEDNNNTNQDSELAVLINSFNQRIRIQDSSAADGDASSVPSGSLGDYFIGPGFEMLLQRLAENDPNSRYGTPPATKEAVESLETVRVVGGGEGLVVQCSVCLDDFEVGVEAKEMPCKHKFHSECLLPWLELHSSCPVCRYLLPSGDDDGEAKTDAETSSNVSMENNGTSVDSSSNNPSVND